MRANKRFACLMLVGLWANAWTLSSHVQAGGQPLAGVRVYPDRLPRTGEVSSPPCAITDEKGRFQIELTAQDDALVIEKAGYVRRLMPLGEVMDPVVLNQAPHYHVEKALVVRLAFLDQKGKLSDDQLRQLLFSRDPGRASAANYFYEISKGSLLLEEGGILTVLDDRHPAPRRDSHCSALCRFVLEQFKKQNLTTFDQVNNQTGALIADGKPDHLWIIPPGPAGTVTLDPSHLSPVSFLMPLPWQKQKRWGLVFFPEESPLGNIVHELLHAMGEHRVDDLYMDVHHPLTAGIWDLMDAGQYRGWDSPVTKEGPWQTVLGYSPSHPCGWVRADLWYRGAFKETVSTHVMTTSTWEGWLDPIAKSPGALPQRLVIPMPGQTRKNRHWSMEVRRPWGFERGRVGHRTGSGYQGLIVMRVSPDLLSENGASRGPVHVIDAHPITQEPAVPRLPAGRWALDDAAFNVGEGEQPEGADGPLHWRVLEVDGNGTLKVRVWLTGTSKEMGKPRKKVIPSKRWTKKQP